MSISTLYLIHGNTFDSRLSFTVRRLLTLTQRRLFLTCVAFSLITWQF